MKVEDEELRGSAQVGAAGDKKGQKLHQREKMSFFIGEAAGRRSQRAPRQIPAPLAAPKRDYTRHHHPTAPLPHSAAIKRTGSGGAVHSEVTDQSKVLTGQAGTRGGSDGPGSPPLHWAGFALLCSPSAPQHHSASPADAIPSKDRRKLLLAQRVGGGEQQR